LGPLGGDRLDVGLRGLVASKTSSGATAIPPAVFSYGVSSAAAVASTAWLSFVHEPRDVDPAADAGGAVERPAQDSSTWPAASSPASALRQSNGNLR
jgi:hypothetical protein